MKQLQIIQGQKVLKIFLLLLCIAGVGASEVSPQVIGKIMYFVAAMVSSIGSVKVYRKWKSGASDLQPTVITWFGSFLFLLMGNTIMLSLFGN